jgi:hypothetical protein
MRQLKWWAEARKPLLTGLAVGTVGIATGLYLLWLDNRKPYIYP